jgi:N-acetylglucosaminyldiphosphoundecaprenol N-acetyl-beta-D-mannosaminyltransferase
MTASAGTGLPRGGASEHVAPTYQMLGVTVQPLDAERLCQVMDQAVLTGERWIVGNHNLHSIYLFHRDAAMRRFYDRARYVFIDGMSLILVGQLLGLRLRRSQRITAIDWLRPILAHARARGWGVYFVGSAPGVAERAAEILRAELPGLRVAVSGGFFDTTPGSADNEAALSRIRNFGPQVLIVGMGMPRQESWVINHLDEICANIIMNQGAFLDYVAGVQSPPPRWLSRLGFEWLCRLVYNPRRLARRYLVEPWSLLPLLLRDVLRARMGR